MGVALKNLLVGLLAAVLSMFPVQGWPAGPLTTEQLVQAYDNNKLVQGYATGMVMGIIAMDAEVYSSTGGHVYCAPGKLPMSGKTLVDVLSEYMGRHSASGSYPVPTIAVEALKETFPCDAAKN